MKACGQEVHTEPTLPSEDVLRLRCRLILEEALEFVKGAGFYLSLSNNNNNNNSNAVSMSNLTLYPTGEEADLQEMYDAVVDINYVSYGAAAALGVDVEKGHEEVHRSNMTKVSPDGVVKKDAHGKVIKPPTFSPADLKTVLAKQGYNK
jgi:predicted HAD superfamily Cof-like phosphohydrolase